MPPFKIDSVLCELICDRAPTFVLMWVTRVDVQFAPSPVLRALFVYNTIVLSATKQKMCMKSMFESSTPQRRAMITVYFVKKNWW